MFCAADSFIDHLRAQGRSPHTIDSYAFAVRQFRQRVGERIDDEALLEHREWLAGNFSAKTTNLRLTAINSHLDFIGCKGIRLKRLKMQQKPFLDNVISQEEYERLRDGLCAQEDWFWYFVVRFSTCTGARVSELRMFTVESVKLGHLDIVPKGDKLRRIYIPSALRVDALSWLEGEGRLNGCFFTGPNGTPMTARGISLGLKRCAKRCGVNPEVVYPHSFRHCFAKNFIVKDPDIAFLTDLMGHESIETTRIYLRRTAAEQRAAVDAAIDW